MEQKSNNIVDIRYQQTGEATATNALGMREMQAKAYEARQKRFLLIKAPPALGKSRALMFIALDFCDSISNFFEDFSPKVHLVSFFFVLLHQVLPKAPSLELCSLI